MKYYLVLTMFVFCELTSGHPLSNDPSQPDNEEPLNHQDMLERVRSTLERSIHTYGMNLTSDQGYVWNSIGLRRPIIHNVGIPPNEIKNDGQKMNEKQENIPQLLGELLNYEPFWRWLSDWSTAYIQILSDYISKTMKEEISKEVQMYFSILETSDYIQRLDKINAERIRDQLYLEIKHKLIEEGLINISSTETLQDKNIANADLKEEVSKLVQKEIDMLRKRKDKDEKRPNNNDDKENRDKNRPFRIEADKIYGNSVGNEKVINIYIFNQNKDTNEIIEELKPITEGVANGTFTFGPQESISINVEDPDKDNDAKEPADEIFNPPDESENLDESEVVQAADK